MSGLVRFCSRVQLHLLLQKGRLINSESAFFFALGVPSVHFLPHNRKQAVLIATEPQEKRGTDVPCKGHTHRRTVKHSELKGR